MYGILVPPMGIRSKFDALEADLNHWTWESPLVSIIVILPHQNYYVDEFRPACIARAVHGSQNKSSESTVSHLPSLGRFLSSNFRIVIPGTSLEVQRLRLNSQCRIRLLVEEKKEKGAMILPQGQNPSIKQAVL